MHLGTSKHWLSKWKKKLRCFLIVFWRVQGRSFFLEIQGFWGIQKWHGGTISPWTWNGVGAKNPEFITRVYLFKFYLNNYLHFYTLSVRDGIRYYILLEVIEGCVKVHLGISWAVANNRYSWLKSGECMATDDKSSVTIGSAPANCYALFCG